jgi:hypothetical protein
VPLGLRLDPENSRDLALIACDPCLTVTIVRHFRTVTSRNPRPSQAVDGQAAYAYQRLGMEGCAALRSQLEPFERRGGSGSGSGTAGRRLPSRAAGTARGPVEKRTTLGCGRFGPSCSERPIMLHRFYKQTHVRPPTNVQLHLRNTGTHLLPRFGRIKRSNLFMSCLPVIYLGSLFKEFSFHLRLCVDTYVFILIHMC